MIKMLDTESVTASPIIFPERKPEFTPSEGNHFQRCTPEECGIDSFFVKDYAERLYNDKTVGLQSLMLLRGDRVFFEAAAGDWDSRFPKATFSQCKSIVSLAIGVLATQGRLRLSERIIDIFPEKAQGVARIRLKNVTVKTLLNMTSCVTFNESEAAIAEDWVKEFLNSDTDGSVGKDFRYNSLNTYMLSAIIREKTSFGLSEFLDSTIFRALDIKDYYWEKCPMGIEKGGWGLYIRSEDMAKLGLLVMQKGIWGRKRLISPKYIELATHAQAFPDEALGDYDYGFQIWCGRNSDSFLFNGMLGQNLLGYRRNGVTVLANCGNCDTFQQNSFFAVTDEFFDRDFEETLPENPAGAKALSQFKAEIKAPRERISLLPYCGRCRSLNDDLDAIDGMRLKANSRNSLSVGFAPLTLQAIQGNYASGLSAIEFRKHKDGIEIKFIENAESHTIIAGFDKAVINRVSFNGEIYSVNVRGRFSENEEGVGVLTADCCFLETPYSRSIRFYFDASDCYAVFSETPGLDFARNAGNIIRFLAPNGQRLETVLERFDKDYLIMKWEKAFAAKVTFDIENTESEQ